MPIASANRSRLLAALPLSGLVMLLLASSLVPALPPGAGPVGSPAPTRTTVQVPSSAVGAQALSAAADSLEQGRGPAGGLAVQCTGSVAASYSCSLPAARPAASGSGDWVDLSSFSGQAPSPRWLAGMTYDAADHYVLLFAGENSSYATIYSDTWAFANDTWTELNPSSSPSGRYLTHMAYDSADGYVVLFGGYTTGGSGYIMLNDTWTYRAGTWTNVTSSSSSAPEPRWRDALAYDAADGYVVLFGGTDQYATIIYNDTWTFHAGTWTNRTTTGSPVGRYRAAMTYDSTDGYILLFGGCTSTCSTPSSDTWKYLGGAWTKLSPSTHPNARVYPTLADAPVQGGALLFGGSSSPVTQTPQSDTWLFASGNWTNLTSSIGAHPPARGYSMLSYDPVDNLTVLFGGANSVTSLNDTWSFGPGIVGRLALSPPAIALGLRTNITVHAASAGSWIGYNYTLLPPGCTGANASYVLCQPSTTGLFGVAVDVNDSLGQVVSLSTTLQVVNSPAIQTFTATPAAVSVNTATNLSINATGGILPVSYDYVNLPSGCSSQNRPWMLCSPGQAGVYTIEGIYSDANGAKSFANLTLAVNPDPKITAFSIVPLTVDVGQFANISVAASLGTTPYTYSYSGLPGNCTSMNTPLLACQAWALGTVRVYANVTDAAGAVASANGYLTVNPALVASAILVSGATIDVGETMTIDVNASGGTGSYTYAMPTLPPGCTATGQMPFSCQPSSSGMYTVVVVVTDQAGYSVSSSVQVTVNALPAISTVSATPNPLDLGMAVNLSAGVSGGTAPLTYAWTNLPKGCAPANASSLTCTPEISGSFSPTVRLTDARGKTGESVVPFVVYPAVSVTLSVKPSPPTVGASATFVANSEGGNGVFTYVWQGLPSGCAPANQSTIRCTAPAGTYTIRVQATDSLGGTANDTLTTTAVAAPSGGSTILGLPATEGYAVIGVIVAAAAALAAFVLLRRRRSRPAPAAAEAYPDET